MKLKKKVGDDTHLVHLLEPASLFSRMYPLMGLPPSLRGGSQERVIESTVVAIPSGAPGLPGGSVGWRGGGG